MYFRLLWKVACSKHLVTVFNFIEKDPTRGGSRAAATSRMECFVIIVNGFQPLAIITKHSILDVAAVLDPPLSMSKATNTKNLGIFWQTLFTRKRWSIGSIPSLNNPSTSTKTYWIILKTFLNSRKVSISPLLLVNDTFVTNYIFLEKANIFNEFFSIKL